MFQNLGEFLQNISAPVLKVSLLIGGGDEKQIKQELAAGVDIVVGTPSKIQDMADKGSLDLSCVRFFIIDEADRVVDTFGISSIMKLFSAVPSGGAGVHRLQVDIICVVPHPPQPVTIFFNT